MARQASYDEQEDVARRLAKFPPTIWGCSFASFSLHDSEIESYTKQVEELKEIVKDKLTQSTKEIIGNVEFIDLLSRLGVSYHFESEIERQLNLAFTSLPSFLKDNNCDLYTVGLLFRVLRQHGHKVPCDVFNKFKYNNGVFKEDITSDVKGLLSLYEASAVSVHGEEILDEAFAFTKQQLQTLLGTQVSPHLVKHIQNALLCPVHYGMGRLQARLYISLYEEEESRNKTLLKFAKLDHNRLQLLYREELAIVSRWWKDLDIADKLSYARDRIVEAYVWALGCISEPQFALCRVLIAKYTQLAMAVDDTYDAYGTIDELRLFTASFDRCCVDGIDDQLPEKMKYLYEAILKTFEETENDANGGSSYKTSYAKEMFKELSRADLVEAEWFNRLRIPTFDEYMKNALITTTGELLNAAFFLGLKDAGMKEIIWVRESPKIAKSAKLFARLFDDIASHQEEQKRGDCPSSVECYMNEFGVSQEKAYEELMKIIGNAWKDINEEYMKPGRVPRTVLKYFLNFARMSNFVYKIRDAYTYSTHLKTYVSTLFLEPLPV